MADTMTVVSFEDLLRTFETLHKVAENYNGGGDPMDPVAHIVEAARLMLVEMRAQGYAQEMAAAGLP